MAGGLFLVGTDRGVGKTITGVAIVALLRQMGVDATLMTPIATGGAVESAATLLRQIGVEPEPALTSPITYETLASPYVAGRVEEHPPDLSRIHEAFRTLQQRGTFVVVEGGGVMVPITRRYMMVDLLEALDLPPLIVARTARGTLNHCLLALRMLLVRGIHPLGFVLNEYGKYGDGFAESFNPDALRELVAPTPVLATLEWRPEHREARSFAQALERQTDFMALLRQLAHVREPS